MWGLWLQGFGFFFFLKGFFGRPRFLAFFFFVQNVNLSYFISFFLKGAGLLGPEALERLGFRA